MVEQMTIDHDVNKLDWVVLVINKVNDRPNQVRYQRIVALAKEFNVVVVTNSELPQVLGELVHSVYLAKKI